MSYKSLLAPTLVGALVLFLIGAAAPAPSLSATLVGLPVSLTQLPERETAVNVLVHYLVDQEQAQTRAGSCSQVPRPSGKVEAPAPPAQCVASCAPVADCPTPPVPPANPGCEPPQPFSSTCAPPPCSASTRIHTLTMYNGP